MKLHEIADLDVPIGVTLIQQLMAKGVPVFYQDMGRIRMIRVQKMPLTNDAVSEVFIQHGDGNHLQIDHVTIPQFEVMDLRKVQDSEIEEWQLV